MVGNASRPSYLGKWGWKITRSQKFEAILKENRQKHPKPQQTKPINTKRKSKTERRYSLKTLKWLPIGQESGMWGYKGRINKQGHFIGHGVMYHAWKCLACLSCWTSILMCPWNGRLCRHRHGLASFQLEVGEWSNVFSASRRVPWTCREPPRVLHVSK